MKMHLFNKLPGVLFLTLFGFAACTNYTPKPQGYFRIELPEPVYQTFSDYPKFTFDISSQAKVEQVREINSSGDWFNLHYPSLNATIYCSYLSITPPEFADVAADSREFVNRHVIKASAIEEQAYANPEQKVYGLVYLVKGKVASPVQFVLTDSVSSFFRGALYFDSALNQDSIAPVLKYVTKDIEVLMGSFRWTCLSK